MMWYTEIKRIVIRFIMKIGTGESGCVAEVEESGKAKGRRGYIKMGDENVSWKRKTATIHRSKPHLFTPWLIQTF